MNLVQKITNFKLVILRLENFFNRKIIRISGQTFEGFSYSTYSKVFEDNISTRGMIFINEQFVNLSFVGKNIDKENINEKIDDLAILVKYTQRVYS